MSNSYLCRHSPFRVQNAKNKEEIDKLTLDKVGGVVFASIFGGGHNIGFQVYAYLHVSVVGRVLSLESVGTDDSGADGPSPEGPGEETVLPREKVRVSKEFVFPELSHEVTR